MNPIKPSALIAIFKANNKQISAPYISAEMKRDPPVLTVVTQGTTPQGKPRQRIDLDGRETQAFISRRLGHIPTSDTPKPAAKAQPKKRHIPIDEQLADVPAVPALPKLGNNTKGTAGYNSSAKDEVKLKDENLELKNEKLRIDNSQVRGDLVKKMLTGSIFKMIYGIHENQFKSIAVKSKSKIESAYTSDYPAKADEILEALGLQPDKNLKTEILKILNMGESDRARIVTEIMEDETGAILKNIQHEIDRGMKLMET